MKSVVEEASSVAKAVEQAWERVGKPREFTIKVFEEPKYSFFGFTTQSAKIALIFDERTLTTEPKQIVKTPKPQEPTKKQKAPIHAQEAKTKQKDVALPQQEKKQSKALWNDEMISSARTWISDNMKLMGLPNVSFSTSAQKYYLRFKFETPVLENKEKEKKLFSAFAHLLMATLRNKFQKEFRGLKVVLTSN